MRNLIIFLLRRAGISYVLDYPPPATKEYYGDIALAATTQPLPGQKVGKVFKVKGASRAFEGTILWRLYSRDNTLLAKGFAQGGSMDGPAAFEFDVSFNPKKAKYLNPMLLVVEEDDPSDGESKMLIAQTRTPLIYTE